MLGERFYLIDNDDLAKLERVARRLFTETRLNGDEMRDLAQTLMAIHRGAGECPVPSARTGHEHLAFPRHPGSRWDVCECGATRRVDDDGTRGDWHVCDICQRPEYRKEGTC